MSVWPVRREFVESIELPVEAPPCWVIAEAMSSGALSPLVCCDAYDASGYNRVMPIFEDESPCIGKKLLDKRASNGLDLGTGSGILAVLAAKAGADMIGVDINRKAVIYAERTAEINGLGGRCAFLHGDLYGPVRGRQFDLVVANPPFVPLPPSYRMFLSADGGPDGLSLVRPVLEGLRGHLAVDGIFLMLTMGLGDKTEPLLYRLLRDTFRPQGSRITTTHIYESRNIEAEAFFELFRDVPTYSEWRQFLERQNLTHLYYMLHEVVPNGRFEHVEEYNSIPLLQEEMSGSWAGRLNRFRRWFEAKRRRAAETILPK